jgi:hypothetical protein
MLTFNAAEFAGLPPAERFLHELLLTALRDGATRTEVRFGEGWALTYQRVDGRDWEVQPPAEDALEELKPAARRVCVLVRPERPGLAFQTAPPGATVESPETGWLTYRLDEHWIDFHVVLDPQEPGGRITFELDDAAPFSPAAAAGLNAILAPDE